MARKKKIVQQGKPATVTTARGDGAQMYDLKVRGVNRATIAARLTDPERAARAAESEAAFVELREQLGPRPKTF